MRARRKKERRGRWLLEYQTRVVSATGIVPSESKALRDGDKVV